jgi:hypothetical protein
MKSDFWLLFVILSLRTFIHVLSSKSIYTYTLMLYHSGRDWTNVYVPYVLYASY